MSLRELFSSIDPACDVRGCEGEDIEMVVIKPFDPIDHNERSLCLCPKHQEWAEERNEFAERMIDKMREFRAELAHEHAEEAKRLATPEDAEMGDSTNIEMEDL